MPASNSAEQMKMIVNLTGSPDASLINKIQDADNKTFMHNIINSCSMIRPSQ